MSYIRPCPRCKNDYEIHHGHFCLQCGYQYLDSRCLAQSGLSYQRELRNLDTVRRSQSRNPLYQYRGKVAGNVPVISTPGNSGFEQGFFVTNGSVEIGSVNVTPLRSGSRVQTYAVDGTPYTAPEVLDGKKTITKFGAIIRKEALKEIEEYQCQVNQLNPPFGCAVDRLNYIKTYHSYYRIYKNFDTGNLRNTPVIDTIFYTVAPTAIEFPPPANSENEFNILMYQPTPSSIAAECPNGSLNFSSETNSGGGATTVQATMFFYYLGLRLFGYSPVISSTNTIPPPRVTPDGIAEEWETAFISTRLEHEIYVQGRMDNPYLQDSRCSNDIPVPTTMGLSQEFYFWDGLNAPVKVYETEIEDSVVAKLSADPTETYRLTLTTGSTNKYYEIKNNKVISVPLDSSWRNPLLFTHPCATAYRNDPMININAKDRLLSFVKESYTFEQYRTPKQITTIHRPLLNDGETCTTSILPDETPTQIKLQLKQLSMNLQSTEDVSESASIVSTTCISYTKNA